MSGEAPKEGSGDGQELANLRRQLADLMATLTGTQQELAGTREELEAWQAMEKHPPVPQILQHLGGCPNCRPQLDQFLSQHVNSLPPEKVKDLARQHKLWPPPAIDIPGLSRRARG